MPINSRNKGAQFERDVAKILNGFFADNNIDFQTKQKSLVSLESWSILLFEYDDNSILH